MASGGCNKVVTTFDTPEALRGEIFLLDDIEVSRGLYSLLPWIDGLPSRPHYLSRVVCSERHLLSTQVTQRPYDSVSCLFS